MSAVQVIPIIPFPAVVAEAAWQAVETTLASICGSPPVSLGVEDATIPYADIISMITFSGDLTWSFSLLLPKKTASELVRCFTGGEVAFASPDMGDAVGKLAHVIAGDLVARLDSKKIDVRMSLPLIARGKDVKVFASSEVSAERLGFLSNQGRFWVKMAAMTPL